MPPGEVEPCCSIRATTAAAAPMSASELGVVLTGGIVAEPLHSEANGLVQLGLGLLLLVGGGSHRAGFGWKKIGNFALQ